MGNLKRGDRRAIAQRFVDGDTLQVLAEDYGVYKRDIVECLRLTLAALLFNVRRSSIDLTKDEGEPAQLAEVSGKWAKIRESSIDLTKDKGEAG